MCILRFGLHRDLPHRRHAVTHRHPARRPVWDTVSTPHRLALGLRAMKPGEPWLELDQDLTQDLRVKDELLRSQRDQVFCRDLDFKRSPTWNALP